MHLPAVAVHASVRHRLRAPASTGGRGVRRALAARALLLALCALAGCTPQARRERALQAVRRSLRSAVYAADQHKVATGSYANFLAPPGLKGVTVVVRNISPRGFRASATHRQYDGDDLACEVGIGPATPVGLPEGEPGGPRCR